LKTVVPNYYNDFKCIADKCRHSCCIGWEIQIDSETLEKYNVTDGELGKRLADSIDGDTFRLDENERCPFLNENGLCDIILHLGEDRLSQICTDHPRFCTFWSDRTEIGLGLCCEEAARIILSQKKKTKLVALRDDGEYGDLTEEEEALLCERERMFAIAQDRSKSISARILSLCEAFHIDIPQRSFAEWVDLLRSMEIMDGAWDRLLSEAKETPISDDWETAWERLLWYFIYRHVSDPERDIRKGVFFSVFSLSVIRCLFAYLCARGENADTETLVELCRLYSSEIEYSEENTERIMDLV
jgi:lysine-N-methylase